MEAAEFPSDLVGFTCCGGSVWLTPSTNLNQQTEIFSEMPAFSLNPKRPPGEEWPGQTVNCDHTKKLCHFFQIICSGGKQLWFSLWTQQCPRKNIQNSVIDKKYVFKTFLAAPGPLAFAVYQGSTVVLLCEVELKCEKESKQYLLND